MNDEEYLTKMEKNANARIEVVDYIKNHAEVRNSYHEFVTWCRKNNPEWFKALYRFPKISKFFYN